MKRFLFRFLFVYLVLYSFPFPLDVIPVYGPILAEPYNELWHKAVPWVGERAQPSGPARRGPAALREPRAPPGGAGLPHGVRPARHRHVAPPGPEACLDYRVHMPRPRAYGIWEVEELWIDGKARPPLVTDAAVWRRVIFEWPGAVGIQRVHETQPTYYMLRRVKGPYMFDPLRVGQREDHDELHARPARRSRNSPAHRAPSTHAT